MVTSYALVVPVSRGEEARRFVASQGIGRSDLKLGKREGVLLIPITQPVESSVPDAKVEVAEFEATRPPGSYKERVQVPPELRPALPSSFDIVGDIVLIKIPRELDGFDAEIGRAILEAHPNIRSVFRDEGVEGPLRIRSLRCLAGDDRTRTTHSEYGARFHVDVAAAYFSPRLANDHHRVGTAVRPGEVFVDATAGVGPFSIIAARAGLASRIVAIDLNPAAVLLLRENLALNRIIDRVEVIEGDAMSVLGRLGVFHRVAINLPHSGEAILEAAWRGIAPGGQIHYFAVFPEAEIETLVRRLVDRLARVSGRGGRSLGWHVVHPYSPKERMVAVDFAVL